MSDFKAKMRQIRFPLGLRRRPRWESSQHSPYPLAVFKRPTSKGREGKGKEIGGKGNGTAGEGKGGRVAPPIGESGSASAAGPRFLVPPLERSELVSL